MYGFIGLARPKGFEPLTSASGGQRSIQLSYGRNRPTIEPSAPALFAGTGVPKRFELGFGDIALQHEPR